MEVSEAAIVVALGEDMIEASLTDAHVQKTVVGPDLAPIIKMLAVMPSHKDVDSPAPSAAANAIVEKQHELAMALDDLHTAELGSKRLQELSRVHYNTVNAELTALLAACKTRPDVDLSYHELDRKRAQMEAGNEAWLARMDKTRQDALHEAQIAIEAINSARDTLAEQVALVEKMQGAHHAAWEIEQARQAELFASKLKAVTVLGQSKKPAGQLSQSADELRQQVTVLQQQLMTVVAEAEARHSDAITEAVQKAVAAALEAQATGGPALSSWLPAASSGLAPAPARPLKEPMSADRCTLEEGTKGRSRSRSRERREAAEKEKADQLAAEGGF